ncbi:hypothetical protein [Enterovibrio norvegicus]|uniref:Uncharacterized protein n=1 Tax=Enterovibrio norvegicus TaxID=188144 RepID=A0ABV4LBE7_9GAMM
MIKSQRDKEIEELAKQFSEKDKRLSWETCLKKARQEKRLFNRH